MSLHKQEIIMLAVVVIPILIFGFYLAGADQHSIEVYPPEAVAVTEVEQPGVIIHIAGAVKKPGVYELPGGSRVFEAIEMAGGPLVEAELNRVNLAAPLRDGSQIYIPAFAESNLESYNQAAGKVNLNLAGKDELATLPGIGPTRAQSIVDYRERNGYFQNVDDLMYVSGIGSMTLAQIQDKVTLY